MYTVTLNNAGGELDSRKAKTPAKAAEVLAEMVLNAGALYSGDSITIVGEDGDE